MASSHLVRELHDLAMAAAAVAAVRHRTGRGESSFDIKSSATDPVTAVDRDSETLIVEHLLAARPRDGVLAEEGRNRPSESGVRWIIDPLDGTVNYLYGFPSYAVSVAAELDGELVAGVVIDTSRGMSYSAARGAGAWLDAQPLARRATSPPPDRALVATGFSYRADERAEQAAVLAGVLPLIRDIRRAGSAAIDLCWAASGTVDAYFERYPNEWDVAAGTVIGRECGLQVHWDPTTKLVVAAPPELYGWLVELLAAQGTPVSGHRR